MLADKTSATLKEEAATLLRKYDAMRLEFKYIEHELARACADYGRSIGIWGMNRDHLRMQIKSETPKEQSNG